MAVDENGALESALRVPYVMDVHSCPDAAGRWVCHLEYDGIPGCVAESHDPLQALDELEAKRVAWVAAEVRAGRLRPVRRLG